MTAHKFTVGQCCCGCTLKTGSLIIAILSLVMNIINLANAIYAATSGYNSSWVAVIVSVLHSIVSILLFIGIQQDKQNFVMVWVWVSIVMMVLCLITAVVSLFEMAWANAILMGITLIIYGYFTVVVRSYALSIGEGDVSPA